MSPDLRLADNIDAAGVAHVVLRGIEEQDLTVLFTQQLEYTDPPDDRTTLDERWRGFLRPQP